MAAPTLTSGRRFPASVRLKLQLTYARAFEALAETHSLQAAAFVRRLQTRLSIDDALDRFFHELPVPSAMQSTVRARALITLAATVEEEARAGEPESEPWSFLRPDLLVDALRRRAHYVEEVNLASRLAASAGEEAVAATHVRMALAVVEVLADELPPDEAVMHYVRTFDLPSVNAQMIFQRTLALLADRAIQPGREPVRIHVPAPAPAAIPVCLSGPRPSTAAASPGGAYGLRVIV